jgi:DNA-binding MarR family transcriptional regulator
VTASESERVSGDGAAYVEKLWLMFDRLLVHSVAERALSSAAAKDLTATQFDGLRFLARHPHCTIGDIAGGLVVSYPAATRLVSRLEKRGLAARTPAQTDHRVVNVALTELGSQAERSTRARRAALLNRVMENLPDSRRRSLVSNLERFLSSTLTDRRLITTVCLRCGTDHDDNCLVNRANIALTGSPLSPI